MLKTNHNAVLYFQRTVDLVIDEDCPYLEPEIKIEEVPVYLSIEEQDLTTSIKNKGVDRASMDLTGRLVKPRTLSSWMSQQRQAKIKIKVATNQWIEGSAYIIPIVASRLGLESFFGDYIKLEVNVDI